LISESPGAYGEHAVVGVLGLFDLEAGVDRAG
jgi:hypothetical protein